MISPAIRSPDLIPPELAAHVLNCVECARRWNGFISLVGIRHDERAKIMTMHPTEELATPNTPEPAPTLNNEPPVWGLVISDMVERNLQGVSKYGGPLQPFNGRNALVDAYQEALDLAVYLRQKIYEESGH